MKLFVGWSGETQPIAEALRKSLPHIVQGLEVFISVDLAAGLKFNEEIRKSLRESKAAIFCLSSNVFSSPWMHYEAGYAEACGARVIPYVANSEFGDLPSPWAYLQAKKVDKEGTRGVVMSLAELFNKEKDVIGSAFEKNWPELRPLLTTASEKMAAAKPREANEVLGDVLTALRRIESAVEPYMDFGQIQDMCQTYARTSVSPTPVEPTALLDILKFAAAVERDRIQAEEDASAPSIAGPGG